MEEDESYTIHKNKFQRWLITTYGTRDQIANICWIMEKAREFQKNICFIDYAKAFDCVISLLFNMA